MWHLLDRYWSQLVTSTHVSLLSSFVFLTKVTLFLTNEFIKRALASANVPSVLKPNSLSRDDGKRPDCLNVLPWTNGRSMIWDFTCPNTLATSHLNRSVLFAGSAVNEAERRKVLKYRSLSALYSFEPVAVEWLVHWARSVRLLPQPRTPDHVCDNWDEVILVPDAAAECRCATWQCRVCVGNCSGFNRTGQTVIYLGLYCCYLFLCEVYINIDKLKKVTIKR